NLSEDLQREKDTLREQQHAISQVLHALAREPGLQPVLDAVAEACRRLCRGDSAAIWLVEGDRLMSVAHHGENVGAAYDREHPHGIDRSTAAGRVAITRTPVHLPALEA